MITSVLGILICLMFSCTSFAEVFKKNVELMGTNVEMTAWDTDEVKVNAAFDAAIKEIERIENEMSEWREGTAISIINQKAGGEAVKVSEELFHVISAAQRIPELSNGAFDISWAGMRGLWRFAKEGNRVPTPAEVMEKLPLVNYKNIELDKTRKTVFPTKPGMAIGLGGIAKGYAIDRAMRILDNHGVRNAIVKAGGDMRVQGTKDGKPWEIGIQHPREKSKFLLRLNLSNISVSTSGDYERFFIKDGILYHHIIDPGTGYPAKWCQSVTILAQDTITSDALSTAVFVLGPEKGMKLIKSLPGIEAIIVDSHGNVDYSGGGGNFGLKHISRVFTFPNCIC